MGVLDILKAAALPAAAARGGYLRGQQQAAASSAESERQSLRDKLAQRVNESQIEANEARAAAADDDQWVPLTDADAPTVYNRRDGTTRRATLPDGTPVSGRPRAPARGTPEYLRMLGEEEAAKSRHTTPSTRDRTASAREQEEEQLGLAVINQVAPNADIARRFKTAYENIRRQFPDLKPGIVAHRAAQSSGYYTASGTLQRPPKPEEEESSIGSIRERYGIGGTSTATPKPAAKPPAQPARAATPAPGTRTSQPKPKAPLATRVQQLKGEGKSKAEARVILQREGYDLSTSR